jgi:hypothetical protein
MAVVVVGGQARKVGKTSVVAGLIAALPERRWTAIKVTDHAHGELDVDLVVYEERERGTGTDSSRYLEAGAARSFWVRVPEGGLAAAMPRLRELIAGAENAILESNNILEFIEPDLALFVADPTIAEFKKSALLALGRADALVMPEGAAPPEDWPGLPSPLIESKRSFRFRPPQYVTAELAAFVAERVAAAASK